MKRRIILAGGTGFIGTYLKKRFEADGYDVVCISRGKQGVKWSDKERIVDALENSEMLINLSGKSVDCRYSDTNKWKILTSRTETTILLHEMIKACSSPPPVWINFSTATIYQDSRIKPMTEEKGVLGDGFSEKVAKTWERVFFSERHSQVKQVALRTAIVIGDGGGALTPLRRLVKMGLGGKQGDGKQMVSWIHIEDVYRTILWVKEGKISDMVINCSAPEPVNNEQFMKALRKQYAVSMGIPLPERLLKWGAFLIRTEPELIMKSRWVVPERLLKSGFLFQFETIDSALDSLQR